jgi:plasmid stability protein
MPDILIKQVPDALHRRLKEEAVKHHRSMARHALALIESSLEEPTELQFPAPAKTAKPLTQKIVSKGIKEGRL